MYSVDERGLADLERAMMTLDAGVAIRVNGDMQAGSARAAARLVRLATPVLTGALKKSVRVRRASDRYRGRKRRGMAANLIVGGRGARHALLVERGTKRAQANPFVERTIDKNRDALRRAGIAAARASFARVATAAASRI